MRVSIARVACVFALTLIGCEPNLARTGGDGEGGTLRFSTGAAQDCLTCICEHAGCGYDNDCPQGQRCVPVVGHGNPQCVQMGTTACDPQQPACAQGSVCAQTSATAYACGTLGVGRDEKRCTEIVAGWQQGGQCRHAVRQLSGQAWDPRGCKQMQVHRVQHGNEWDINPVAQQSVACLKQGTCSSLVFSTDSCDFLRDKCASDMVLERCRQELELSGLDYKLSLIGSQTLSAPGATTAKQYVCQKGKPTTTQYEPCDYNKRCGRVNDVVTCSKADGSTAQATCCPSASGEPHWHIGMTSCPKQSCASLEGQGSCYYGTVSCSGGKGYLTCCDPQTRAPISGNRQGVWCSPSSAGDTCNANTPNSCFSWSSNCVNGKCQQCAQGKSNCDGIGGCECNGHCQNGQCVPNQQTMCQGCTGNLSGNCYPGNADNLCGVNGSVCLDCAGANLVCRSGKCVKPTNNSTPCGGCVSSFDGKCHTQLRDDLCGANGSSCVDCTFYGQVCRSGRCVLDPSAPNNCVGCTINGVCTNQIGDTRCGSGGNKCLDCTSVGKICSPQGSCVAPNNPPPCSGCVGKSSGNCYSFSVQHDGLCGSNGSVCRDCKSAGKVCNNGRCETPSSGTFCWGCRGASTGNCYDLPVQHDKLCGSGGSTCLDCTSVGKVCVSGQCVSPQGGGGGGGGSSCGGCRGYTTGTCYSGSSDNLCGKNGVVCQDCAGSGLSCSSQGNCI